MNASARPPDDDGGMAKSTAWPKLAKACLSISAWLLFLIPAALGFAADLGLKSWAFPHPWQNPQGMALAGRHPGFDAVSRIPQDPWTVIPNVLQFTTTVNQGAVFGIAQGNVGWFLAFSVLALVVIVWVFATSGATHRIVHLALGLILAGALGNMYDRAVYHGVRDMLKFNASWYPFIFNIADVLLCLGVPLLIARWLFVKDEPPVANAAPKGV